MLFSMLSSKGYVYDIVEADSLEIVINDIVQDFEQAGGFVLVKRGDERTIVSVSRKAEPDSHLSIGPIRKIV